MEDIRIIRYKNNSSSGSFSITSQSFEIKFIKKKNFPTPTGSDYFIVSSRIIKISLTLRQMKFTVRPVSRYTTRYSR